MEINHLYLLREARQAAELTQWALERRCQQMSEKKQNKTEEMKGQIPVGPREDNDMERIHPRDGDRERPC